MFKNYCHIILAAILAAANIFTISAAVGSEELHNFANYNIRYTNNSDDTGERLWSARGSYVMQIIKDYDFDIVGMEEVTGRTGQYSVNPLTNTSQLQDLQAGLKDYTLLTYERDGAAANKDYSYNVIAYKTNKYECLANGCFWISPTPEKPSVGWDPNYTIKRTCAWAKIKVKSSGEIFYFAVAHCNYGPSLDGPNGGNLVANRLSKMAGNLPIILVGDFNMRRDDHKEAYREYTQWFSDAALTAEKKSCLPESNGMTSGTAQNWYPVTSSQFTSTEYDFAFYRNMNVAERYIITENYGRSVNPSDHFPILMRCRLGHKGKIYVNNKVLDTGDGSITLPYNNITAAVNNAVAGDTIFVSEGKYKESLSIASPAVIIGGYDASFKSIKGYSELDGDINGDDASGVQSDNISNLITANYVGLNLNNFILRNAYSASKATDGALVAGGAELRLNNASFEKNTANVSGAGIIAQCRYIKLDSCKFNSNNASESGAGALLYATDNIDINKCLFDSNIAKYGSALYLLDTSYLRLSNSTFSNNANKQFGAFYFPTNTSDKTFGSYKFLASANASNISLYNNTFANNILSSPTGLPILTTKFGGAAIYAQFADANILFNIAHTTITGNTSTFAGTTKSNYGGSAVRIYGGKITLMNNIIAGNYSEGSYSDIFKDDASVISKDQYNIISASNTTNISLNTLDFKTDSYDACVNALPSTLDGTVKDGKFVANIIDNGGDIPTVKIISKQFAGNNIAVLSQFLRYIETSFSLDLNDDGKIGGALLYDERGANRESLSVPGSCEYIETTGIEAVTNNQAILELIRLDGNRFRIIKHNGDNIGGAIRVYNMSGVLITEQLINNIDSIIDLSSFENGIYIISSNGINKKVLID